MFIKNFNMRGDYTITVKRRGKVTREENFHNLFTNGFISRLISNVDYFKYCWLGSGSSVPTVSDTALTTPLWVVENTSAEIESTSADKLSRTWKYTYKFPANSSYVGTIREVGLTHTDSTTNPAINTHALIVDAEAQPISIEKTYLDEITITAKITITRPSWQSGQTWSFMSGPFSKNSLAGILRNGSGSTLKNVLLSTGWCPEYRPVRNWEYTSLLTQLTYSNGTIRCSAEFSPDAVVYNYDSANHSKVKDYVNSLLIGASYISTQNDISRYYYVTPPYRMLLPNSDVFPVTTLTDIELGTGDGSTIDFNPEVCAWLKNTEVVYKNGVQLTRGVDYQVDNLANIQKYRSVMISNFVADIDADIVKNVQGFVWGTEEISGAGTYNNDCNSPVVKVGKPIILKYATAFAFSNKANYYVLGTWVASASIASGANLVFYYSADDGSTWTEFGRITHSSAGTDFVDTSAHNMQSTITGITHVKIALENTTTSAYVRANSRDGRFGYVGQYAVRFTTAPADGDVLTMDMDIDRPWKSTNNLIQWNPILSFGG